MGLIKEAPLEVYTSYTNQLLFEAQDIIKSNIYLPFTLKVGFMLCNQWHV
jgi:hypothetical protein